MGTSQSTLTLSVAINKLIEDPPQGPAQDEFWIPFFTSTPTLNEVFTVFSSTKIREIREKQPQSLGWVIYKCVQQIHYFCEDISQDPKATESINNSVHFLTRLLPLIYEHDEDGLVENLFWKNQIIKSPQSENSEIVKLETLAKGQPLNENETLGACLVRDLMKLLFTPHYCIPKKQYDDKNMKPEDDSSHYPNSLRFNLLWQGGLAIPQRKFYYYPSSAQQQTRTNILRCLIAVFSSSVYVPNDQFTKVNNRFLDVAVSETTPNTANLFYSLLNVIVNYNPVGLLPYSSSFMGDPVEDYVMCCLHVLGLLVHHIPEINQKEHPTNVYSKYLANLSQTDEIKILYDCVMVLMRNAIDANTTYLPSSQKLIKFHEELVVILWKLLEQNESFRKYLFKQGEPNLLLEPLVYLFVQHAQEPTKYAFLQMEAFIFLMLSQHRDFGIALNKPYPHKVPLKLPLFTGTYADFFIISMHKAIAQDQGIVRPLFNLVMTSICNISPYVKKLSITSSVKLVGLFEAFSKPRFLYTAEKHWELVDLLLMTFNNLIQYQYEGNINLVYAIIRRSSVFENLSKKPDIQKLIEINEQVQKKKQPSPVHVDVTNFVPSAEWLVTWKPKLQLDTILALIHHLNPEIDRVCEQGSATEDDIVNYLKEITLVGILPPPSPIVMRTFVSNVFVDTFVAVYFWGLIYCRHYYPSLFDGKKIKLFKISFGSESKEEEKEKSDEKTKAKSDENKVENNKEKNDEKTKEKSEA